MIILLSRDFPRLTAPAAMLGHLGAVSLKKSQDIVILSFFNIVKGQANDLLTMYFCTSFKQSTLKSQNAGQKKVV